MDFHSSRYKYLSQDEVTGNGTSQLVSVVLTTYNGQAYLAKQLESLFNQTYLHIEIVAVDDRSTDNTVQILNEYAAAHRNMKVFVNEVNVGFVKNFDKACSFSTGRFIALCDQDDYWHEDKVKKLVDAIESYSLVYCDSYLCNEQLQKTGKKISDIVNCKPFSSCLEQAVFCRIYGHASLFTRELYQASHPFLEAIPHDWWLCYMATLRGGIGYLPEPLVWYRQHSKNLFGAVGGKRRQHHKENARRKKQLEKVNIRTRVNAFYKACPHAFVEEKKVLLTLVNTYHNFSLINNFRRSLLFLKYRNTFLGVKKHSALHKILFCFKMFVKIK